jgi:hypothetical protein
LLANIGHGNNGFAYGLVLILHLIAVIAGLGPTYAYPMFGSISKRNPGPGGEAILRATVEVAEKLEFAIYAIPVFGVLLVLLSDDVFSFGDGWIIGAIVLYVAAIGVSTRLHLPNLKAMNVLQRELVAMGPPSAGSQPSAPPPQVTELEARGKRAGMYGGILHVLLLLILIDMVVKPGWP